MYYKMIIENLIIGSGPSSLQLAYYYKKNNIDYLIIEKESCCASFFLKYPHSKQLISINKKYTGKTNKDFNLRHDWNSLLNDDDFLFNKYSDELYPSSLDLHLYLNDFAKFFELNIKFNTNVNKISKLDNMYKIIIDSNIDGITNISCKNLIIATGLSKPTIPDVLKENNCENIKHYADYPNGYFTDKENLKKYINKKVLIIGGGNAGYELANLLQSYCSTIIIIGKQKPFSITTHYVGDIRSIYMPFLDTFYLKSLNGIDSNYECDILQNFHIEYNDTNKNYKLTNTETGTSLNYNTPELEYFDEIICCTGWHFDTSIFDFDIQLTNNNKYPETNYKYESINNKNLFFIGSLMHSKDFKKSSGGFIHGFRYLIKLFTQINYNIPFVKTIFKFTGNFDCYNDLFKQIYNRINNASSLYQMHSVLCDLYYYDETNREIIYIQDITKECIEHFNVNHFNLLFLEYGESPTLINKLGEFNKYNPAFLHPKIYCYKQKSGIYTLLDRITFEENIISDFKCESTIYKIKQTLKMSNLIV